MAASMKNEFSNSLQVILQLLNTIEKKKVITQKSCVGVHDLFKPWACRGHQEEEVTEKPKPIQKEEDKLSVTENAELEIVNKLLSKAERAYKVKQKLSEPVRPNRDVAPSSLSTSTPDSLLPSEKTDISDSSHVVKENVLRNEPATNIDNKKNARKNNNLKNGPTKPASIETEKNKNAVKNTRPRIDHRKPHNSSSVHTKAPFQTNPSIPFPKKSTSITKSVPQVRPASNSRYRQVKGQPVPKNSNLSQGKGQSLSKGDFLAPATVNKLKKEPSVNDNLIENKTDCADEVEENFHQERRYEEEKNPFPDHDCNERIDNKHLDDQESNKRKEDSSASDGSVSNATSDPEKQRFNLLSDGTQLPIPGKLKKYVAHNRKLKKKYDMNKVTKKVDGVSASERIKTAIEMSFTDHEEWRVLKNVTDMTNIYTNLRKYFESLDLGHISESSSVYELLRCRKSLEVILSLFQHLEEKRNNLETDYINNSDYIGTCRVDVIKPDHFEFSIWLPDDVKDIWLPQSPLVLQYRSVRQLERYSALLFQIQYCQYQSYMHEVFAQEILPFLKSLHPKSSEFIHLLRSSFSLLTDDESFPVLVHDTIQELEESVTDDN